MRLKATPQVLRSVLCLALVVAACDHATKLIVPDDTTKIVPGKPLAAKVLISRSWVEAVVGDTATLVATPVDASNVTMSGAHPVSWVSRDTAKVRVSATGLVTVLARAATKPDTIVWIIAMIDAVSDSAAVYVHAPAAKIRFAVSGNVVTEATVLAGSPLVIASTLLDSANVPFSIVAANAWISRDTALLRVTGSGLFAANANNVGPTYVIASRFGAVDSILVRVYKPGYVWPDTNSIIPGMTRALALQSFNQNTGVTVLTGPIAWVSSNPAVASVDSNGLVTAKALGQTTITADQYGSVSTAVVYVISPVAPLQFVGVSHRYTHGCGLIATGEAYCWGANDERQLGTDASMDRCESLGAAPTKQLTYVRSTHRCSLMPRRVETNLTFVDVQVSADGACGLTTAGAVHCWGSTFGLTKVPPTVLPAPAFKAIAVADAHACGIAVDDIAHCWGDDANGVRGDGAGWTKGYSAQPVSSPAAWSSLGAGFSSTCGLDSAGVPYCWGSSPGAGFVSAQAGNCYIGCMESPTLVAVDPRYASARFTKIVASWAAKCAISTDGRVYCWGGPFGGSDLAISLRPVANQPAKTFVRLFNSLTTNPCAITADGELYCLAFSLSAPADSAISMSKVDIGVPLKTASGHGQAGCGIATDNILYCWSTPVFPGPLVRTRVPGQP